MKPSTLDACLAQARAKGLVVEERTFVPIGDPAPAFDDEEAFRQAVRKIAKRNGWRAYHTHNSRKSDAGFPDEVFVRGNRVLFVETKTKTGKLSAAQETWKDILEAVGGNVEYYLWRPHMWASIERILA